MTKDELLHKLLTTPGYAPGYAPVRLIIDEIEELGLLTFDKPLPPLPVVKRGDKVRVEVVHRVRYQEGPLNHHTLVGTLVDLEKL